MLMDQAGHGIYIYGSAGILIKHNHMQLLWFGLNQYL